MKKGTKQLIALIIVLAVCIGIYLGISLKPEIDTKTDDTKTKLSPDLGTITSLSYYNGSETIDLENIDGSWVLISDKSYPIDSSIIDSFVKVFTSVVSSRTVSTEESLENYGLDDPKVVTVTDDTGTSFTLRVGNAAGSNSYVQLENDETIYLVSQSANYYASKSLSELAVTDDSNQ